jgi:hypothetical protein
MLVIVITLENNHQHRLRFVSGRAMSADGCMRDAFQAQLFHLSRLAAFCVVMHAPRFARLLVNVSGSARVELNGENLVILGIKF